jgi:hypothetical protein
MHTISKIIMLYEVKDIIGFNLGKFYIIESARWERNNKFLTTYELQEINSELTKMK